MRGGLEARTLNCVLLFASKLPGFLASQRPEGPVLPGFLASQQPEEPASQPPGFLASQPPSRQSFTLC